MERFLNRTHVLRICKVPSPITDIRSFISICYGVDDKRSSETCRGSDSQTAETVTGCRYLEINGIEHYHTKWCHLICYAILLCIGNCHVIC